MSDTDTNILENNLEAEETDTEEMQYEEELEPSTELAELSLTAKISALFFVYTKPLTIQSLSELTNANIEDVEISIEEIKNLYKEEIHGFSLVEVATAYQLRSAAAAKKVIAGLIPPKARRLSKAAAETLAIIAYKQPLQKSEIEAIRGVDAMPTLRTLLDSKLIRIVGREDSPGQPALYGTTDMFLEKFGLKDLSELPTIREVVEMNQEPGEADLGSEDSEEEERVIEPEQIM